MSWPRQNRKAVIAEIASGLKTVKAIAEEVGCSEGYVYTLLGQEGYAKQFITTEEWRYIVAWRANRARYAAEAELRAL